jgi:hypothetical protein
LSVPNATTLMKLPTDTRLAIPQHPDKHGLVLDIGRVLGGATGAPSRILYAVNTSPGSSGAPVLASGGKLVALHEGNELGGQGDEHSNRGIRISAFNGALAAHLPAPFDPSKVLERWCIGGRRQEPLIGRRRFVRWIEQSREGAGPSICVVTGPQKSGKSFSARILISLTGWQGDHVLVFRSTVDETPEATDGIYAIPARPQEFIAALAKEIGLDASTAPPEPPRPEIVVTDLGEASARELKPDNWASVDLPKWLAGAVSEKLTTEPDMRVWLTFDLAPDAQLSLLLRELLYAIAKRGEHDSALSRFRWVFLGVDPEVVPGERFLEGLNPTNEISVEDVERLVGAAYGAAGKEFPKEMSTCFEHILKISRRQSSLFWSDLVDLCVELIEVVLIEPRAIQ